jgi:hypothetical protein
MSFCPETVCSYDCPYAVKLDLTILVRNDAFVLVTAIVVKLNSLKK